MNIQIKAMMAANNVADNAVNKHIGGPFGASIVNSKSGEIVMTQASSVIKDNDPTAHAEINCIRKACEKLNRVDLAGYQIYSTGHPCPMCLAAIYWANLDKIYIGIGRETYEKYGLGKMEFINEPEIPFNCKYIPVQKGICEKEIEEVFKKWHNMIKIGFRF